MYQCYSFYTKLCSVFVSFGYLRNEGIRLILRFDRDLLRTIMVNSCPLLWSCVDCWFMFMHPFRFVIIQAAQQQQESKHTRHHYPHTHYPVPTTGCALRPHRWLCACCSLVHTLLSLTQTQPAYTAPSAKRYTKAVRKPFFFLLSLGGLLKIKFTFPRRISRPVHGGPLPATVAPLFRRTMHHSRPDAAHFSKKKSNLLAGL